MRISLCCVMLWFLVSVCAGCGGETGPKRYEVIGVVSFDGQPLPDGDIQFLPAEGTGTIDGGKIADGKFALDVTAGKKRVEIRATRETKEMVPSGAMPGQMEPKREDYIPAKYNTASTLTAEVKAGLKNIFEFKLTTGSP